MDGEQIVGRTCPSSSLTWLRSRRTPCGKTNHTADAFDTTIRKKGEHRIETQRNEKEKQSFQSGEGERRERFALDVGDDRGELEHNPFPARRQRVAGERCNEKNTTLSRVKTDHRRAENNTHNTDTSRAAKSPETSSDSARVARAPAASDACCTSILPSSPAHTRTAKGSQCSSTRRVASPMASTSSSSPAEVEALGFHTVRNPESGVAGEEEKSAREEGVMAGSRGRA